MAQMAWGDVTAYGTTEPTIESGSGFSVERQAKGIYQIEFSPGFNKMPALTATQQYSGNNNWHNTSSQGGDTRDNVTIISISTIHARVKTGDNNGVAQDRNFSFIAIGE